MIYVFEVCYVLGQSKIPLHPMVESISAKDANQAREKLESDCPEGWSINKATLVGSRGK